MRTWNPVLKLGPLCKPETGFVEKFGGLPWGLPPGSWPVCEGCGNAAIFYAQLAHDAERLDLGRAGRALYVFVCAELCDTLDDPHACRIVEIASLAAAPLPPPVGVDVCVEARVLAWRAADDGVPPEHAAKMFEPFDPRRERDVPRDLPDPPAGLRVGGVPAWIQDPPLDGAGARLALQLDDTFAFDLPAPEPAEIGIPRHRSVPPPPPSWVARLTGAKPRRDSIVTDQPPAGAAARAGMPTHYEVHADRWTCEFGGGFGDAGMVYVLLHPGDDPPTITVEFQCC